MRRAPANPAEAARKARAALRRKALRALKRARTDADKRAVELTAWEGDFLGSLEERITAFGRAFADPEKGAPGAPFSVRQARKLKEIRTKIQERAPEADPVQGASAPEDD